MKKVMFFAVMAAMVVFTSCGTGDKKEETKQDKTEIVEGDSAITEAENVENAEQAAADVKEVKEGEEAPQAEAQEAPQAETQGDADAQTEKKVRLPNGSY